MTEKRDPAAPVAAYAEQEIRIIMSGWGSVTRRGYDWINLAELGAQQKLDQQPPPRLCATCVYFRQWPHLLDTGHGVCRSNPITHMGFPPTTKDNWCGEWKER
jgi:hypothetical protein